MKDEAVRGAVDGEANGSPRDAIGAYPRDWRVVPLGALSGFITKGSTPTTFGFRWQSDGVLFLRSECVADEGLDLRQSMYISQEAHEFMSRSEVRSGDILMTITGNVGRVVLLGDEFGSANINQHIARIRIRQPGVIPAYVHHFLNQPRVRKYYESIITGQAYPQISLKQVRETPVALPSETEQRAIADVLSDCDGSIATLVALVAKKRNVQRGVMHDLLTGRARLPGFTKGWTTMPMREIGTLRSGAGFPLEYQGQSHGRYPFFKVSDMNGAGNETSLVSPRHWVSEQVRRRLGATVFPKDTIVFAKVGAAVFLERKRLLVQPSCIDNNLMAFTFDETLAQPRFVLWLLHKTKLSQLVSPGALPSLNAGEVGGIELKLPQIAEQQAIAEVLDDVEAEIAVLCARLRKAQAIKSGLADLLLSARVSCEHVEVAG